MYTIINDVHNHYTKMARLSSNGISRILNEALYSSLRGWARLLLHCLRNNAGNSLGPPEELCEIVLLHLCLLL